MCVRAVDSQIFMACGSPQSSWQCASRRCWAAKVRIGACSSGGLVPGGLLLRARCVCRCPNSLSTLVRHREGLDVKTTALDFVLSGLTLCALGAIALAAIAWVVDPVATRWFGAYHVVIGALLF